MTPDERLIRDLVPRDADPHRQLDATESWSMRLGVVLAAPVWLGVLGAAAFIRLVRLRLPVIVMHERVGYQRNSIWVPKIATAKVPANDRRFFGIAEVATGPPVELDVDGRVEQWLRRTGLDELPQLLLVARGAMRVVGPRPVTKIELAEMAEGGVVVGVDFLQPGLIGLWQVLDRHAYTLAERRELDMLMIANWSPRLRRSVLAEAARQALTRLVPPNRCF